MDLFRDIQKGKFGNNPKLKRAANHELKELGGEKTAEAHEKKVEMAKKMPKDVSDIFDRMESAHKKKMKEINSSNRPDWEKAHMRRAHSSGIGRFLFS